MYDVSLITPRLMGINFTRLLKSLKTNKYRVARDCGLSWRTLRNWERGITKPSKENAEIVGKHLGLISDKESEKIELRKQMEELDKRLRKLE